MNLYTALLLSSFLLSLFLASFVYNLNKKNRINRQFAVFCLTMACWSYFGFELHTSTDIETAHFWNQLTSFFPFAVITLLHFLLNFIQKKTNPRNTSVYIFLYGMGVLATILYLLKDSIMTKKEWGWSSQVTNSTALLGTMTDIWSSFMGFLILAIATAYYIKTKEARTRKQAQFIVYALSLIIVIGLVSEIILPNFFSIASPPLTTSAFSLSSLIIGYAVWKFRLFSLDTGTVAENVIATLPDGLILTDTLGIIIRANEAAEKMFQYNRNELLGKNCMVVFQDPPNGDTSPPWMSRVLKNQMISNVNVNTVTKDKSVISTALSAAVITDETKNFSGMVCILRDLTNRKQAEKWLRATLGELSHKSAELEKTNKDLTAMTGELMQAEKLTMLGELIISVIHELSHPLNLTKVICQSIIKDIKNNRYNADKVRNDLPEIVEQIDKMANIVDHMRVFSRTTRGEANRMININDIIEDSFSFVRQDLLDNGITIQKELGLSLPGINGDPIRFEQLILNLITNAKKALESCQEPDKILGITTRLLKNSSIVIEVMNNGYSIPEDNQKKMFEPIFTTGNATNESGIRLSVVKKISEELGGKIEIENKACEETIFRVILPITKRSHQVEET